MTRRGGRCLTVAQVACGMMLALLAWTGLAVDGAAAPAWADDTASNASTASTTGSATTNQSTGTQAAAADSEEADSGDSEGSGSVDITLDESLNSIKENQLPDSSFIYDTSIVDLAGADTYYDQQTVQVVGEVVGDIVNDSLNEDYCWVVLWDKDSTLTLYMKRADAALIDTLGAYGKTGTMLQVRGIFNLVCADHDGASDLHVSNVTVTAKGKNAAQQVSVADFLPGIFMVAAGLLLLLLFRTLRERQR